MMSAESDDQHDDSALPSNALNHTISLTHLIEEGTRWILFQLLGVSALDGQLYIVAHRWSEIGIFVGNPLVSTSWKLKYRFAPNLIKSIQVGKMMPMAFSHDFSEIGLIVSKRITESLFTQHVFIVLDLNSSQWSERPFVWHDTTGVGLPYTFSLSHTCTGWILHFYETENQFNSSVTVYRLSTDPTHDLLEVLCEKSDEVEKYIASIMFATYDCLFWLPFRINKFMYVCHLDRDEFVWERCDMKMEQQVQKYYYSPRSTNATWNNVPMIRLMVCECILYQHQYQLPLAQRKCPACLQVLRPCQRDFPVEEIYTFSINSETNSCRWEKLGQFREPRWLAQSFAGSICLSKTKRFALILTEDLTPRLILNTMSFKPISLQELSSVAVLKTLCKKSKVPFPSRLGFFRFALDVYSGGPSDEVKKQLGLVNKYANFSDLKP